LNPTLCVGGYFGLSTLVPLEVTMESPLLGWLVVAAFGLLLSVTLGVVYITTSEWRDRRRRENEGRTGNKSK
jgi:CHASE1-domain containing sensor protein